MHQLFQILLYILSFCITAVVNLLVYTSWKYSISSLYSTLVNMNCSLCCAFPINILYTIQIFYYIYYLQYYYFIMFHLPQLLKEIRSFSEKNVVHINNRWRHFGKSNFIQRLSKTNTFQTHFKYLLCSASHNDNLILSV